MFFRCWFPLIVLATFAGRASAHGLGAEIKPSGNRLKVEAFFDDDSAAGEAKVSVEDTAGKIIASGVTDKDGVWELPMPADGGYRLIIDAGAGHRAKLTFTVANQKLETAGPTRAQFTRTPWGRILAGIGVIAVLAIVGRWFAVQRNSASSAHRSS